MVYREERELGEGVRGLTASCRLLPPFHQAHPVPHVQLVVLLTSSSPSPPTSHSSSPLLLSQSSPLTFSLWSRWLLSPPLPPPPPLPSPPLLTFSLWSCWLLLS